MGIGFVTVKHSNHYGIAGKSVTHLIFPTCQQKILPMFVGYYSEMALKEKMVGFSFTNTSPLVVPTRGTTASLGTNPIAVGMIP